MRDALLATLPPDHALVDVYDVWLGEAPLPGRVSASVYRSVVEAVVDPGALRVAVAALMAEPALPRVRRKGDSVIPYDLRLFIEDIEVDERERPAWSRREGGRSRSG